MMKMSAILEVEVLKNRRMRKGIKLPSHVYCMVTTVYLKPTYLTICAVSLTQPWNLYASYASRRIINELKWMYITCSDATVHMNPSETLFSIISRLYI
jgi:hypothetical protein